LHGDNMNKLGVVAIIVVIAIIIAAAAYYYYSTQQSKTQKTVTIHLYTSMPTNIATQLIQMFEKKYPNIHVELYRSGTSKVLAKLQAEIESGHVVCDIIWVADPSGIVQLKDKGYLLKFTPNDADRILYKDPDGYWYAGRIIVPVIAWNTQILKSNHPTSWLDLASPQYKATLPSPWNKASTWAAIPNPLYSGAATVVAYVLSEKYGWKYFEEIKNNGVTVVKSNSAVLNGIINKEYPVGVTLDYMVRQHKANGDPVDYVFPKDAVILIPSPIAILKTTPHPDAAKTFVNFILSKEVQEWLSQQGFIPARSDVKLPAGVPALNTLNVVQINWDQVAKNLENVRTQFQNIMMK